MTLLFLDVDQTFFAGYGVPCGDLCVKGLLMVDRPFIVPQAYLDDLRKAFGQFELYVMTQDGSRGLGCYMFFSYDDYDRLIQYPDGLLTSHLEKLCEAIEPQVYLNLYFNEKLRIWTSEFRSKEQ